MHSRCTTLAALFLLSAASSLFAADLPPAGKWIGTLQSAEKNAGRLREAGATFATVELAWDQFEPVENTFDEAYAGKIAQRIQHFQAAGLSVVLDLGVQYPPAWTRKIPGADYQNQHGDTFASKDPGANGLNAVFSVAVRDKQARYVTQALKRFGKDCPVVRLGWGFSGELNYPAATFNRKQNCYWAFDPVAQGKAQGLPKGMAACPVAGWLPGQASADHTSARQFAQWYMESLRHYHDWQIQVVRDAGYQGKLAMLYPSWGIRPGQLDAAIRADLAGTTSPEKNGELQRGFDFSRVIGGIRDKHVIVYCTWMDSDPKFGDDKGLDQTRWSPARYLASLARSHNPPLDAWGENTGRGDAAAMTLSFTRAREYRMLGLMWAFEPDFSHPARATLEDFAAHAKAPASQRSK